MASRRAFGRSGHTPRYRHHTYLAEQVSVLETARPDDLADHVQLRHCVSKIQKVPLPTVTLVMAEMHAFARDDTKPRRLRPRRSRCARALKTRVGPRTASRTRVGRRAVCARGKEALRLEISGQPTNFLETGFEFYQ